LALNIFKTEILGEPLEVEIGKMALLANGSCLVRFGETVILTTVTMSDKPKEGMDFFPLVVDFEEKLYSVGKIPGSFSKREGKPSEKAILISRLIDRSIRPLFPKNMKNDVAVVCTALSVSENHSPEVASIIGASIALAISDIPWNGPVASTVIGLVKNKIVVNPSEIQINDESDLNLTVSSTIEKILMIEAGANQVNDNLMFDCIMSAHEINKKNYWFYFANCMQSRQN
jgi:polyribonucleotide nucleotidyltransferase